MGWDKTYFHYGDWEGLLEKMQVAMLIESKTILSASLVLTILMLTTLLGKVPLLYPSDRRGNGGTET